MSVSTPFILVIALSALEVSKIIAIGRPNIHADGLAVGCRSGAQVRLHCHNQI